jgi:hypothetical protein
VGGGPAGAFAAERLASAGLDTVVFDEKLAWEKPCGGGLTYKAYHTYPFLIENNTPKKVVTETILSAPRAKAATLRLSEPLLIYSRMDLNRMMLERAERAGARIEKARVLEINRTRRAGAAHQRGRADADFCVVATGARNPLRDFGTQLTSRDSMSALGYYVPGDQAQIDIQFLPHLEGYIWIFPRCGHLSVGICGKGEPAASLRKRLENYMAQRGICWKGAAFYSHLLPSLELRRGRRIAWRAMAGWRWATPPAWWIPSPAKASITRCARPTWRPRRCSPNSAAWRRSCRLTGAAAAADFAADLEFGSRLAKRVFLGRFLFGSVPARMVQFTRRSSRFSGVMQDLFAGTQPYLGLKNRLMRNLNGSLYEIAMSLGLSRLPGKARP